MAAAGAERSIEILVDAANRGDAEAWNEIVDRYSPLLVTVVRQFRLPWDAVDDVAQTVWLRLVEHLGELRDPAALPKWIITIARREALRHIRSTGRARPVDPQSVSWSLQASDDPPVEEGVMRGERHEALLAGLAELSARQRQLLLLLIHEPPLSYAQISAQTGIPVGAIGPTRSRAVDRLRRSGAVAGFLAGASHDEIIDRHPSGGGKHGRAALG